VRKHFSSAGQSVTDWRNFIPLSVVGAFVFFGGLWLLDFPKPTSDDLFYVGAGLNLAGGGDYSNPLIVRQEFPSHFFFVYPPLPSYALAAWLKLFGISSASVTAYPILNCLIITGATIVILRRHKAPVWLEWLVPLGVAFVFLQLGLRAESTAVALLMAGFALADADLCRRKAWLQFTGFFLMFLGASSAPRMTLFGAGLFSYAGYCAWKNCAKTPQRWSLAGRCLAAFLAAGFIFLFLIDFRIIEFWRDFHYFAAGRVFGGKLKMIAGYLFEYLGYLQMPVVLLPLALLLYTLNKPKDSLNRPAMFIAATFPFVIWAGGIGSGTAWWAFLIMLLLAGSIAKNSSRPRAMALLAAITLLLLVIDRKILAQAWGDASGSIKADQGDELAAALRIQPTPEHPVLLDGWVARYVFDYRLPPGSLDLASGTRFPGMTPGAYKIPEDTSPQLRPEDIFVVGNYMLKSLKKYTYLEHADPPTWNAFGIKQLPYDKYPRWVYIISAKSCKDVRVDAAMPLPTSK